MVKLRNQGPGRGVRAPGVSFEEDLFERRRNFGQVTHGHLPHGGETIGAWELN